MFRVSPVQQKDETSPKAISGTDDSVDDTELETNLTILPLVNLVYSIPVVAFHTSSPIST